MLFWERTVGTSFMKCRAMPEGVQGLFLTLFSGIFPGSIQGTIYDAKIEAELAACRAKILSPVLSLQPKIIILVSYLAICESQCKMPLWCYQNGRPDIGIHHVMTVVHFWASIMLHPILFLFVKKADFSRTRIMQVLCLFSTDSTCSFHWCKHVELRKSHLTEGYAGLPLCFIYSVVNGIFRHKSLRMNFCYILKHSFVIFS